MLPSSVPGSIETPIPVSRRWGVGNAAQNAQHWLLHSGVYILDPKDPNYGAVYSYYDPAHRRFELVYAEATGYVISLLRYLYAHSADKSLVHFARASGDWLIGFAAQHAGIISMGRTSERDLHEAYAFDNGICCKGLLDLY